MFGLKIKLKKPTVRRMFLDLDIAGKKAISASPKALDKYWFYVKGKSLKIVPFDRGDLMKSIFDEKPEIVGTVTRKTAGYDIEYAVYQHEAMDWQHPGEQSVNPVRGAMGQPKFLENPMIENRNLMAEMLVKEMKKVLV